MKFKFKKALVTGGAGFIGSHLVERLVKMGVQTVSVDNYFAGKSENLDGVKGKNNFQEIKCDITNYKKLEECFSGIDIVFHHAASKKTICLIDPRRDLEINGAGTFNLLDLSVKYRVKKFVHISTGSVYGEAQYFPQDEYHPLIPTSFYGVSKLAGEKYVKTFNHLYGLDTTVLRYFHVYGPRQESSDVGGVVSIFIRLMLNNKPITIFGDGYQERSFTFVDDVINANILVASIRDTTGEVYNCASGINVTIRQLAEYLGDILKIKKLDIEYKDCMPGDIKIFNIDNSKIIEKTGIVFLTDFRKGLEETIRWEKKYFLYNKEK